MPNMTADIEGRDEILDPRDATQKYTNNGALIFYDFNQSRARKAGSGPSRRRDSRRCVDQRSGERLR
jgi:hypothetical protein